ncbi:hypothetical protein MNV49_002462 [Pseudohyphozyma bogoriensis]|nr:hypothetical protein MNV49_002462 [Pseudohyphozyma bogoriensis]
MTQTATASLQEVIPGLWIGDYAASQDTDALKARNISSIVAAMRQEYDTDLTIHRILIDDSASTNIIAHFAGSNDFIGDALAKGEGVLVHCQAGVSRSTTLVAAFLMAELDLDVESAVEMVRRVRSQVEPTEFFMQQLEMYERCECEWDPVKIASALERKRSGSRKGSFGDDTAKPNAVPMRKRLTARSEDKKPESTKRGPASVEKIGNKEQVKIVGKRIRCKMCRRELAARDHILVHEPGMGQQAFAPHRRNMATHRAEQERRRLDELDREKLAANPSSAPAVSPETAPTPSNSLPAGLAGLRIAKPIGGGVPGLRIAQPRPAVARPAVSRPTPKSSESATSAPPDPSASTAPASTSTEPASSTPDESNVVSETPAEPLSISVPSSEPPLLPSHLCSSYFVEPLSWMSPLLETGELSGRIICPNTKCGAKLGSFDWAGARFALNVSRVDEFKPATA